MNSFSIFRNHWVDLKASKSLGFLSVVKVYQAVKKLTMMVEEDYAELLEEEYRDTMNEWIIHTLIDIKNTNSK